MGDVLAEELVRVGDGLRRRSVRGQSADEAIPEARSRSACSAAIRASRAANCRRSRWLSISRSATKSNQHHARVSSDARVGPPRNLRQAYRRIAARDDPTPNQLSHESRQSTSPALLPSPRRSVGPSGRVCHPADARRASRAIMWRLRRIRSGLPAVDSLIDTSSHSSTFPAARALADPLDLHEVSIDRRRRRDRRARRQPVRFDPLPRPHRRVPA